MGGQGKKTEAIRGTCDTCTRLTHGKGACPGKKVECYGCGQMGHFKGSKICKGKSEEKKKKKNKDKSYQIEDSEDSEGIGRIEEDVRAAGTTIKSRMAKLKLTVLTEGIPDQVMEASFLRHGSVPNTAH